MFKFLIVFAGSGIGGCCRYWLSGLIHKFSPAYFPYGTFVINILGSFILGWMIFGFDEKNLINPSLKLLIGIGFCGGFTTFSTFSLETFNLIKNGEILFAGMNILFSVLLSLVGIYIAYLISR